MSSIKTNVFYSTLLTGANYIFPLIVFPYVSRVLGVTNIGICNFVDSIVHYFVIFSMLGVQIVGVREIAISKTDRKQLSNTFYSIFGLNTILTLIALIIYIGCIYLVPELNKHIEIMWVGALKLVFSYLLIEWMYKGLEEFRFITVRTVIIRSIYVALVFLFVRNQNDYVIYYLLTTISIVLNALVNVYYTRKYIDFKWATISIDKYLKPILILGLYTVLTNMYTTFNVAYLGFVSGETEVGYYTTSIKLFSIFLSVFSAVTSVMLPRMSSLIAEGKLDEYKKLINKTTEALIGLSTPFIILSIIFAPAIVRFIAGDGYEGSILPMRIISPLVFVIGYEQILITQSLMPLKKDNSILINSAIGAVAGILMNILLVSHFGSIGSSIVWVISEIAVLLSAQFFMYKYVQLKFPIIDLFRGLSPYIPVIVVLYLCSSPSSIPSFFISSILTGIYVIFIQIFYFKNSVVISLIKKVPFLNKL